jgi:hypothetical protein
MPNTMLMQHGYGLKGYFTNTDLSKDEVIENYQHLWMIEKAFRISKKLYSFLIEADNRHIYLCCLSALCDLFGTQRPQRTTMDTMNDDYLK